MIARNQTYSDITVHLDGSSFYDCVFERCTVSYSGVLPTVLQNPRFVDCKWQVSGPAHNTVGYLTALYRAGARDLIEKTFDSIRGKGAPTPAAKVEH
jgi:hypothetical protein